MENDKPKNDPEMRISDSLPTDEVLTKLVEDKILQQTRNADERELVKSKLSITDNK